MVFFSYLLSFKKDLLGKFFTLQGATKEIKGRNKIAFFFWHFIWSFLIS